MHKKGYRSRSGSENQYNKSLVKETNKHKPVVHGFYIEFIEILFYAHKKGIEKANYRYTQLNTNGVQKYTKNNCASKWRKSSQQNQEIRKHIRLEDFPDTF